MSLQGKNHIVRIEGVAIVEGDALLQVQGHSECIVVNIPGLGQLGLPGLIDIGLVAQGLQGRPAGFHSRGLALGLEEAVEHGGDQCQASTGGAFAAAAGVFHSGIAGLAGGIAGSGIASIGAGLITVPAGGERQEHRQRHCSRD